MNMMTVKQVSLLTGVSVRTLQFYDEIGLFKPTQITGAGYRMYDENAMEELQQILFFKELDFTLKEIRAIMDDPEFDKTAAFEKQRELIRMKRDRLDSLLRLLEKLIKGEKCMEFKEFDMSDYFRILAEFKMEHTSAVAERFGSLERYDEMIAELKTHEDEIAEMAVRHYGDPAHFTKAMEDSLLDFLIKGPAISPEKAGELTEQTDAITRKLTADLSRDAASPQVQALVRELISAGGQWDEGSQSGKGYWSSMAGLYETNAAMIQAVDRKYGDGAARFLSLALKTFLMDQN